MITEIYNELFHQTIVEPTEGNSGYVEALTQLSNVVTEGAYTQRKNAPYLLKAWTSLSNKDVAEKLNTTVQAVYSAKKLIERDLELALCSESKVLELMQNKDEQGLRAVLADYYRGVELSSVSLISKDILKALETQREYDLENWLLAQDGEGVDRGDAVLKDIEVYLNNAGDNAEVKESLEFIKEIMTVNLLRRLENYDAIVLLSILDVLNGNKGSVELRNKLRDLVVEG